MEDLVTELKRVARIGLNPPKIVAELSEFSHLADVAKLSDHSDPAAKAKQLVELIAQAIRQMPGQDDPAIAAALFGVQLRYRDSPYARRRAMAIDIWDPEGAKQSESFTRRIIPRIMSILATEMSAKDSRSDVRVVNPFIQLGTASLEDQAGNTGIKRLSFRAETWLTGGAQRPYMTEWTFRDKVIRGGLDHVRVFRRAAAVMRVEPITPTIKSVKRLPGTSNYGHSIWLVSFEREFEEDEEIEWGTRTVYEDTSTDDPPEVEWIALAVSHTVEQGPIPRGTFIAHFDETAPPKRVVSFETPKGSLPELLGPVTDLLLLKPATARVDFKDLQRLTTYGIYWWHCPL